MNFLGVGTLEMLLIAAVAFLVVGPARLTEGMRSAGRMLRQLRQERDQLTGLLMDATGARTPEPPARPPGAVPRDANQNGGEPSEAPSDGPRDTPA